MTFKMADTPIVKEALAAAKHQLKFYNEMMDAQPDANPWQQAVDDMLVVLHMTASDDPAESINRLINWHVSVAMDPDVSSDAAALVERGRNEALAQPESLKARLDAAGIDSHHVNGAMIPEAAQPQREPSLSQKMRAAGFTPRDKRLTCDECGAKFTAQMAPLHECAQPQQEPEFSQPQQEPYGTVTRHVATGEYFFYKYPATPYLDTASECVTVYTRD